MYERTWWIRTGCAVIGFAVSIAASGCAREDEHNVANAGRDIDSASKAGLPEEKQAIRGIHAQLTARQRTWDVGAPVLLYANVTTDAKAEDGVFLATDVGLGCRVRIDGRWYRCPDANIAGLAYFNAGRGRMELQIRLDNNWRAMDGGEVLFLSKGIHRVQFAWAGYRESGAKQDPLLLLSNEVEIVVNGK